MHRVQADPVRRLLLIATALCTSTLLFVGKAHAEGQGPQSDDGGNDPRDILVTAQKLEQRLSDVPMSLSVASGEQLANAGIGSPADLERLVPGFTYQEGQFGSPNFGIRGIGFFDFSAAANPAVGVFVDQAPLPYSVLTGGAFLDVERVEVLKGPQGTLFGINTTGGAVNAVAAKPTARFAAGLDATYGRFNRFDLGGFVSGPLNDRLGIRIAAKAETRGDWQRSVTRGDTVGQRDFLAGRLLLAWRPVDAVRFDLNLNAWRDKSDTLAQQYAGYIPAFSDGRNPPLTAALLAQPLTPKSNRFGDWDPGFSLKRNVTFRQAALRGEMDLSDDLALTSLSSYIDFDGTIPTDNDGTAVKNVRTTGTLDFRIFNQELRLSGTGEQLRWMIGGSYEHASLDESLTHEIDGTTTVVAPGFAFTAIKPVNNQRIGTWAGFGSFSYDVSPKLTVQASVRFTDQQRDISNCTVDGGDGGTTATMAFTSTLFRSMMPGFNGHPTSIQPGACLTLADDFSPVPTASRQLDRKNTAWSAGFSYKLSQDSLLFVTIAKGFKAGGSTPVPAIRSAQLTLVEQESLLSIEAGFKAGLLDFAEVTGAIFRYDYRNKQIAALADVFPFGNLPASFNVPRSQVTGVELGLTLRPAQGLRLSAEAIHIDTGVTQSYLALSPFAVLQDIKGQQLPNAPEWQLRADVEYRFALAQGTEAYLGGNLSYRSGSFALFGEDPEFRLPGYALIDLRAGIMLGEGRWKIEAFGRNVANTYYRINVSRSLDAVTPIAGMPATYGLSASFRY